MPSSCYFSKLGKLGTQPLRFVNQHNEAARPSGMFAYLVYNEFSKVFAMWPLTNYESNHNGLHLMIKAYERQKQSLLATRSIFSSPITQLLPCGEPVCGGEVLLDQQCKIIILNLQSGFYSQQNNEYHDNHPLLSTTLKKLHLPPECYISIRQTALFKESLLHHYFEENGQYKPHVPVNTFTKHIQKKLPFPFAGIAQQQPIEEETLLRRAFQSRLA